MKTIMYVALCIAYFGDKGASAADKSSSLCANQMSKTVDLLDRGLLAKPFIFVGEIHGNNETPAFTAALVCRLVNNGLRVLLAIEASENIQIPSKNNAGELVFEKDDLGLSESYWLPEKNYGRTSHAMLKLIENIRPVAPISFVDVPWPWSQPVGNRDAWMAENVKAQWQTGKFDKIIFHGGNLHTQLANRHDKSFPAIADYLNPNELVSIAVFSAGGKSWLCRNGQGCGPKPTGNGEQVTKVKIEAISPNSDLPYSIVVRLPKFTPSFPLGKENAPSP